jgi:hypothetical protein
MSKTTEPLLFPVPLSLEAHALAQRYRRQQLSAAKAKQVYLNTLAVSAVDFYLRCLGWETDSDQSDSYNSVAVCLMDVADLAIKGLGKLECRPVLPEARVCQIPLEARSDRIGYLVVELSPSLKQATILGFTPTAATQIPLNQLCSLAEFPEYLAQIQSTQAAAQPPSSGSKIVAHLRQWFEGIFDADWLPEQEIFGTNSRWVGVRNLPQAQKETRRIKLLDLGLDLGEQTVALMLVLTKQRDEKVSVLVRVQPMTDTYLPSNLTLSLLNESGETLEQVSARSQDNFIQLKRFRGQTGDHFGIEVSLEQVKVVENFLL